MERQGHAGPHPTPEGNHGANTRPARDAALFGDRAEAWLEVAAVGHTLGRACFRAGMAPHTDHDHAGRIREEQNWIGGSCGRGS